MTSDISVRVAAALQAQEKHLLSPLDSKAFVCLLGAVLFALEEKGCIRIEPAEPVHHGRILPRIEPPEKHLVRFYVRCADRTVLEFFEHCTATGTSLTKEQNAFRRALAEEGQAARAYLNEMALGELRDPILFHMLEQCDLSRALFFGPVREALLEDTPDPTKKRQIEALTLMWMLRFVQ